MKENNKTFVRGVATLSIGVFIAKLLGAIYRVPLTNLIGGYGLGLYQTVFPVYALLLDFSGAAVPSALSKLISSDLGESDGEKAIKYFRSSIKLMAILGALGSAFIFIFAKTIARLQGNEQAYLAYIFLAPSVFLVSLISCFRGYFQGLMKMKPTAVSQVIEQVVKLVFGITFAFLLLPNITRAVAGATFAITLSEVIALFGLYITYRKQSRAKEFSVLLTKTENKFLTKKIISTTVPITLVGMIIPLSHVIDSFITVNILSSYRQDATVLYGLISGVVCTVINLPVSVCYSISTVSIPALSSSKGEREKKTATLRAIAITMLVATPCALLLTLFAPFTIKLLFSGLNGVERQIAIKLLRTCSPNVILLSLIQTQNAILIAKGKPYSPLISLTIGVVIKTALGITLLKIPKINVFGSAVALIACYFFTCLINLIMILKSKVKNENKRTFNRQYAS